MNSTRKFFIKVRELTEGITEMGYALFAQKKILLTYRLSSYQLMQTMKQNEQFRLATQELGLGQEQTSLKGSQALEMAGWYEKLSNASGSEARQKIEDEIAKLKLEHEHELVAIENEIYQISVQEQGVEMEIKRLDTKVSVTQKDLDAVQEAEGDAIEKSIPKYKGL